MLHEAKLPRTNTTEFVFAPSLSDSEASTHTFQNALTDVEEWFLYHSKNVV